MERLNRLLRSCELFIQLIPILWRIKLLLHLTAFNTAILLCKAFIFSSWLSSIDFLKMAKIGTFPFFTNNSNGTKSFLYLLRCILLRFSLWTRAVRSIGVIRIIRAIRIRSIVGIIGITSASASTMRSSSMSPASVFTARITSFSIIATGAMITSPWSTSWTTIGTIPGSAPWPSFQNWL